MGKGFLARMGLDLRGYTRGLDQSVDEARAAARRIRIQFETEGEKTYRKEREAARERRHQQREFAKGWRIATVAAAAGLAFVATSMSAAAERSPEVARDMERMRDAVKDLRADIGEDLFGLFGRNGDEGINWVRRMRNEAVDLFATVFSGFDRGHVNAVNAVNEMRRELDRAHRSAMAFREFELKLLAESGDREAAAQLIERAAKRRISEFGAANGLDRAQMEELRRISRGLLEQQRAADAVRREEAFSGSFLKGAIDRARLNADQTAGTSPREHDRNRKLEITLREQMELLRGIAAIRDNDLLSTGEKVVLERQITQTIRERAQLERDRVDREREAQQRDAFFLRRDSLEQNRIEILRLRRQGGMADADQIRFDYEREKRAIDENTQLSFEQKNEMIESLNELARERIKAARERGGGEGIEAGLAGGATLRRQIMGSQDSDGPVAGRLDSILEFLRNDLKVTVTAVAG